MTIIYYLQQSALQTKDARDHHAAVECIAPLAVAFYKDCGARLKVFEGSEGECDVHVHTEGTPHLVDVLVEALDVIVYNPTCKTLGTFNSFSIHNLKWKIRSRNLNLIYR